MEITNRTQRIDRNAYAGAASGAKSTGERSGQPLRTTDAVVISEEARLASLVADMEKGGINRATAEKLVSGKFTVTEPDWDTFEVPTLQGQADPKIYQSAYMQAYLKELGALTSTVQAHYAPEYSKLENKSITEVRSYLFQTYKKPWMKDMFVAGTTLPAPPNGMSKEAADMAHDQLLGMRFGNGSPMLRDPYALGADGMARLDNIEKQAHEAAQTAYDAAQKEYEAEQAAWSVEQKERHKRMYQSLSSGNSTCLGYMTLHTEPEDQLAE